MGDEIMEHPREKAIAVTVKRPYVIEVTFNDGVRREIDIEPLMWGSAFEPLRDPELFAQASVTPTLGSVFWPTGADLAPEFLYYGYDTPYGPVEIKVSERVMAGAKRKT
jgi:hypothetical protein